MTIKHAIPKIEWAMELLYNSLKTGSQLVWSTVWRPDPLVTRCGRDSQHPEEWALRPPVEQPGERERHNADGYKSGGQYVAVLFALQLPLTHATFKIKCEVYFSKNCVARLHDESAYDATTIRPLIRQWPRTAYKPFYLYIITRLDLEFD